MQFCIRETLTEIFLLLFISVLIKCVDVNLRDAWYQEINESTRKKQSWISSHCWLVVGWWRWYGVRVQKNEQHGKCKEVKGACVQCVSVHTHTQNTFCRHHSRSRTYLSPSDTHTRARGATLLFRFTTVCFFVYVLCVCRMMQCERKEAEEEERCVSVSYRSNRWLMIL